nr:MAG TPA: hypothetical protein [Siphoviridae sp. ctHdl3]
MEYRYKPEDAVFVRPDLKCGLGYWMRSGKNGNEEQLAAVGDMLNFVDKTVHISGYSRSGSYYIKEDSGRWRWTDEMFVGLAGNECYCESLL